MKNNLPLEEVLQKEWRVRRVRGTGPKNPQWVIEFDEDPLDKHTERVQLATINGPADLALAFRALQNLITAAALSAFRIHTVLDSAKGVLDGHRVGLKEAKKMLLEVLEQAKMTETLTVLKKISS
jgi:hypothetical protein